MPSTLILAVPAVLIPTEINFFSNKSAVRDIDFGLGYSRRHLRERDGEGKRVD
jgi:hypothetical protein